jgi:hypothetical protein
MERVKIVEDAQLKLVQDKPTYIFESLGKRDVNNTYLPSTKFPIGTQYELVKGEFPPPNLVNPTFIHLLVPMEQRFRQD